MREGSCVSHFPKHSKNWSTRIRRSDCLKCPIANPSHRLQMRHRFNKGIRCGIFLSGTQSTKDEQLVKSSLPVPLKLFHFLVIRVEVQFQEAKPLAIGRFPADELLGARRSLSDDIFQRNSDAGGLKRPMPHPSRGRRPIEGAVQYSTVQYWLNLLILLLNSIQFHSQ